VLLLDHVGRVSGRQFTTPVLYIEDGPDFIIVGSQGGLPRNPQWVFNLDTHPDTMIQVGASMIPVRARRADPVQRARLWPALVDLYPGFAAYQSWTSREIPVVVLSPREPDA